MSDSRPLLTVSGDDGRQKIRRQSGRHFAIFPSSIGRVAKQLLSADRVLGGMLILLSNTQRDPYERGTTGPDARVTRDVG